MEIQHCKPAVDDDTFQKMVDRQYELMRRPRMMDEMNNSKNPMRSDDVDMPNSVDHPAPNTATEAPVSDHEVSLIELGCICIAFGGVFKCKSTHTHTYIHFQEIYSLFGISMSKFFAYAAFFHFAPKNEMVLLFFSLNETTIIYPQITKSKSNTNTHTYTHNHLKCY